MNVKTKKTKISTITLILMLAISAILIALPSISAHDPAWDIPSFIYITAQPNPIGVNQEAFVTWWTADPPPTAAGVGGDRWLDMRLSVITPEGNNQSLGSFTSQPTGGAYTLFTPTQVGTYTFEIYFPGQTLSLNHPITGVPGQDSPYIGDNYLPATARTTLTVLEDPIEKLPQYPLPTEYWDRPIEGQNTAWVQVASNWPGEDLMQNRRVQDYGAAPNSPHIMWTKSFESGGVVGSGGTAWGEGYAIDGVTFYTGQSYERRFSDVIILDGKLYFSPPFGNDASGGAYTCMDLRTGEILWQVEGISPNFGQLYDYESFNQHGVLPSGVLIDPAGSTWRAYDAWTGKNLYNLTEVPGGTEVYTEYGEIEVYTLEYDERKLSCWTTAALPDSDLVRTPGTTSNAYQYRPVGKEVNMSDNYRFIVDIPDLPGSSNPSIVSVIPNDLVFGRSSAVSTTSSWRGTSDPFTLWAINLDESRGAIGDLLWLRDYPAPAGNVTQMFNYQPVDPLHRTFEMTIFETGQKFGYNLDTGELLWGPVGTPYNATNGNAYQYFSSRAAQIAYGNLYVGGYGGETIAISMDDGEILWTFNDTSSGLETPWGLYPNHLSMIADGKIYTFTGEHSPNVPPYKGARTWCIDAYTGEEIWSLLSWSGSGIGEAYANAYIADGFLVFDNLYTNEITCIGKGPSATTVSVQDDVIAKGESVLIKGMVTDRSPGTEQNEQAKRFPNGVPAVADESMGEWMEYVYMQKPCPENVMGVQVKLTAIDPNGNYQDIGLVRSDGYGMFKKMWTPEIEGEYTIVATFEGSNSYWTSYAETAIGVGPAPAPETPIEPEEPTEPEEPAAPLISSEVAIIAAVAVIAVIGLAAYWILRRK